MSTKIEILIMDDEAATRSIMEAVLTKSGYSVTACSNGKEGIDAFRKNQHDLVITDISMPVINGLEVITLIRKENAEVPIIAISGVERSASFLSMADYYTADVTIEKPINAQELLEAVKNTLSAKM
jgi:CheY-like chemotaxis protein